MKKILFAVLAGLALVSCVKDETFPMASISGVKASDAIVGNDVTVTANVSALVDITAVNLLYSAGGAAEQTVKMSGSAGAYTGVIPSQADGTEVKYHVEATTSGGTTASAVSTITFSAAPRSPRPSSSTKLTAATRSLRFTMLPKRLLTSPDMHSQRMTAMLGSYLQARATSPQRDSWYSPQRTPTSTKVLRSESAAPRDSSSVCTRVTRSPTPPW